MITLQHDEQTSKLYQSIALNIAKEFEDFHQSSAAELAIPEPHHPGLTEHGTLIEFCYS